MAKLPRPKPLYLFACRHLANRSRNEIAARTGIPVNRLQVIETGEEPPTQGEEVALENLFGCPAEQLFCQCEDVQAIHSAECSPSYLWEWAEDLETVRKFLLELGI